MKDYNLEKGGIMNLRIVSKSETSSKDTSEYSAGKKVRTNLLL
jgi:hypothetical protein